VPPGWELAALALIAVPFVFTDITARRLPDWMTCQRLHRRLTPLAVAAITGHEQGRHARARSAPKPTPALPGARADQPVRDGHERRQTRSYGAAGGDTGAAIQGSQHESLEGAEEQGLPAGPAEDEAEAGHDAASPHPSCSSVLS